MYKPLIIYKEVIRMSEEFMELWKAIVKLAVKQVKVWTKALTDEEIQSLING